MLDPRLRFTATATLYDQARPHYPAALGSWLFAAGGLAAGDRALDLGCGTGISTRWLAGHGLRMVGLDPNAAMLARAAARSGSRGEQYVRAEAAATGLASGAFKLAIAAQSFHWFDLDQTLPEITRVLRPDGFAAAVWNERAVTPLLTGYEKLLIHFSSDYRQIRSFRSTVAALRAHPLVGACQQAAFANRQMLDRDGLLERARSASYVMHGMAQRDEFENELRALFERHQNDGVVAFDYNTVALLWQPATGAGTADGAGR